MKLEEILAEYNVPVAPEGHRHARPGWVQTDCPNCGPGSGIFHLGIPIGGYVAVCWRCGKMNLVKVLAELTGLPWHKVRELIGDFRTLPADVPLQRAGRFTPPKGVGALLPIHERYLALRGFVPGTLTRLWSVQGIGLAPRLAFRLYIPIHYRGVAVSWTTRSISEDGGKKYITASPEEESVPAKSLLFGDDLARHSVLICEGPLDAMKVGPGAVATLGMHYTQAQLTKMARFPVRYICLDAEPEAQRRAEQLCAALSVYPGRTTNVVLDSGKDPSRANDREVEQLRRLLR